MKKLILLAGFSLMIGSCFASKNTPAESMLRPVINTTVSGPSDVCPNSANVQYYASTNFSGPTYWVEFKCGGLGTIVESGAQTYTITGTGNNNNCHINWGNYNGQTSWVQATYHWQVLGIWYSSLNVENVNIGAIGDPNSILGVSSICDYDLSNYVFSCPNSLPYGDVSYQWSVTNATIVGGQGTNQITLHSNNGSPTVISVKFVSGCAGYYSNTYSITLSKIQGLPLGAGYVLSHIESMGLSGNLLTTLTLPSKPYAYNYYYVVTDPSSSPVYTYGSVAANTTGYINASLAAVGSTLYVNAYYSNSNCGNYWNYGRNRSGLVDGSHNRIGHFESEEEMNMGVYPNPAKDQLNIRFMNGNETSATIMLTDLLGKTLINETRALVDGDNELSVKLAEVPSGVYFLTVSNHEFTKKQKVVVEK